MNEPPPFENSNRCVVCDPANRQKTLHLTFAKGAAGHIIDKHVKDTKEPWQEVVGEGRAKQLKSQNSNQRTADDTTQIKTAVFASVKEACKRPQALAFDEIDDTRSMEISIRCLLIVCRPGFLVAIRNVDSDPKIHSAYFPRGVIGLAKKDRWVRLVRKIRNDHVYASPESGKLIYPAEHFVRPVIDEEFGTLLYSRTRIEFLSKHTWGFAESKNGLTPSNPIPNWEVSKS